MAIRTYNIVGADVDIKGVDETVHNLKQLGENADKAGPAFEKIADLFLENEKIIFKREGGSGGNKWPRNTPSTLASKIAKGLDPRPMRATGALERSLTVARAADQIRWWNNRQIAFGTTVWYAQFSNNSKDPDRKRVVLRILPKTRKTANQIILEHLMSKRV